MFVRRFSSIYVQIDGFVCCLLSLFEESLILSPFATCALLPAPGTSSFPPLCALRGRGCHGHSEEEDPAARDAASLTESHMGGKMLLVLRKCPFSFSTSFSTCLDGRY